MDGGSERLKKGKEGSGEEVLSGQEQVICIVKCI